MDLTNKVALVTGASSGIGEATAQTLGREGCNVALAARRENRLEAVADEIGNDRAIAVQADVTDEDDISEMVERTKNVFGSIDILVNNAGVGPMDLVVEADRSDFRQVVEVNLLGVMNVTHAVLPEMLDSGGGDIVAVSSIAAINPTKGLSAYTATKSGVNGFCRALRKEVAGDGIRVMVVMPGAIDTEMIDVEDFLRILNPEDLAENVLNPTDVAETIAFAVSRPNHVSMTEYTVAESPPKTLFR